MGDNGRWRVRGGWIIVILQWLVTFGGGVLAPGTMWQFVGMMVGPPLFGLVLVIWWLARSQAPRSDRFVAVGLLVAGFGLALVLADPSMRMALVVRGLPLLCLAFVLWMTVAQAWSSNVRRLALVVAVVAACGGWTLLRSKGVTGDMSNDFVWRWVPTAEDRFLESAAAAAPRAVAAPSPAVADKGVADQAVDDQGVAGIDAPAASTSPWPGFRGPHRDSVVPGVTIATDWASRPPELLWRRPIGPGWSSFASAGGRLFTQEQRGEDEVVTCYDAASGEPVWLHSDPARFWEALAGTGPRATPSLADGRVYTFGATGILNALDAATGAVVWSRNAATDSGAKTPDWGFSSSPLVIADLLVVHTGAADGKAVAAYDRATGEPRWFAPAGALSYSSAQLATLGGVPQILMMSGDGLVSLAPADGAVLWQHDWPLGGGARIVQPAVTDDGAVLIGTGFGVGLRRLEVEHASGVWTAAEGWTSRGLKPYFNDFVIHRGHAYGFDGRILSAVALEDGARAWKGGRYGHGQVMLLSAQGLLLVLSEQGELALVAADPAGFDEIAKVPILAGKTWNHPVLVDGVLYVRNGEEMAAYRLPSGNPAAG